MFVPVASLLEPGVGPLLIILVLALLFFGHKLPQIARSMGSSVKEFKKGFKDGEGTEEGAEADEAKKDASKDSTPEKK